MKTLLIIVSLIGLLAVAGAIYMGEKSFDGVVTKNAYEKGLQWDAILQKESRLGWTAEFKKTNFTDGENTLFFRILDKDGRFFEPDNVVLSISSPSRSGYDREYNVIRSNNDYWLAKVRFPSFGYWILSINVFKGKDDMIITKKIFVERRDSNE